MMVAENYTLTKEVRAMKRDIPRTPDPAGYRILKTNLYDFPDVVRFIVRNRKLILINTAAEADAKFTRTVERMPSFLYD